MSLSKYLTIEKAEFTATGLPNKIPKELLPNTIWLGENIVDPVMDHFGLTTLDWIVILYRSPKVNEMAGSDPSSWHARAAAIDMKFNAFKSKGLTNSQLFHFIVNNCKFDRVLWEKGNDLDPQWVHVQGWPGALRQEIGLHWIDRRPEYKYFKDVNDFNNFKKQIYKV